MMSIEEMQDEFEAFRKMEGERAIDEATVARAFVWAWNRSRAAVVVELPEAEVDFDPDIEDYEEMEQQEAFSMLENHVLTRCRSAIEAAGLKVKS